MEGLFKPFFSEPGKHLYRLLTDKEYFTYCRLASRLWWVSRYTPRSVRLHKMTFQIPDALSFIYMYREIFVNRMYAFTPVHSNPKILDLGANIGLSVLFFHSRYPGAEITAVEADPEIFKYLETNIVENKMSNIHLLNKAVWDESRIIDFYTEGADAGSVDSRTDRKKIQIPAIDICELLADTSFDFIKMDIEGAEHVVLPASRDYISEVPYIFVEYHAHAGGKKRLSDILTILEDSGFRLHIYPVTTSGMPLIQRKTQAGFEMQLNIFGWRDK